MGNRERGQDETTEQGQPRIVPERPGWWWAMLISNDEPEVMMVDGGMRATVLGWSTHVSVDDPCIRWLAPIPGPAVLAALAEYGEALAGLDAEPNDWIPTVGIMRAFNDAGDALHAAIRAERDAERDGGA